MIPTPYTPLPFGTHYFQELSKEYELWPDSTSNNPHKACAPICPFWCWMIQFCYFNSLLNNPNNQLDDGLNGEPVIFGLPEIPGVPEYLLGTFGPHGLPVRSYKTR